MRDSHKWDGFIEYNNVVILSGETASRSEAVSQSKDPYGYHRRGDSWSISCGAARFMQAGRGPYELNGGERASDFSND